MTSYVETFEAPHLGMDTESAPNRLARGYGRLVKNGLTGRAGRVPARGSLALIADLTSTGKTYDVAWVRSTGEALLAPSDGSLTMKHVAPDGTMTDVSVPNSDTLITSTHCWVGDIAYGLSGAGTLLRWDGGSTLTSYSNNAPTNFVDVAYWKNRLWCLGGNAVPAAQVYRDRLFWSDLFDAITPLPESQSAWEDDVSGLTNQLVLGSVTDANQPVGIGVMPRGLVVFGTQTSDFVVGDSPSTLTVREAAVTHGCYDKRTIVTYNDGLLWLAFDGFYAFDGTTLDLLSERVTTALDADLTDNAALRASAVRLANSHILLAFGVNGAAWMLNLNGGAWSRFTTRATSTGGFLYVEQAGGHSDLAWASDGHTGVWRPGSTSVIGFGDGTDPGPAGASYPIELEVDSGQAVLSSPVAQAAIQRLAATLVLEAGSGGTCEVLDANGVTLFTSDLSDSTATTRRTVITEAYYEAHTAQLRFVMTGGAASEVGDAHLEYAQAQKPASF